MENKYYTPEIEEFHVGFECELNANAAASTFDNEKDFYFVPYTINLNPLNISKLIDKKEVRVKYLDREDIKSLGWEHVGHTLSDFFKLEKSVRLGSGHWFHEFRIIFDYNNKYTQLEDHFWNIKIEGIFGGDSDILFEGVIKNKSELKRVLKQCGIT